MNRNENVSDIYRLYRNFTAMSDRRKVAVPKEKENGSLITESERRILLERIAGQLGISNAEKLPYVSGLIEA